MTHPVLDIISARRSHRAYQTTPVTPQQLDAILKAAVEAPSAVNRQPWRFTVVRDQQLLQEMSDEVRAQAMKADPDRRSPRMADPDYHVFYRAPLVIFLCADPAWRYSALDCGIAVQNIALAAECLGLGSVILGMPRDAFAGDKADEFKKRLQFPENCEFQIAISIGVPADDKPAHPVNEGLISFVD